MTRFLISFIALALSISAYSRAPEYNFRIRTITAGVTLSGLSDTTALLEAIEFLKSARATYREAGYEVQTIRISTQNFYEYLGNISLLIKRIFKAPRQGTLA